MTVKEFIYGYNESIKLGKQVCQEMLGLKFCEEYQSSASFQHHFSAHSCILYCTLIIQKTSDLIFSSSCDIDRETGWIREKERVVPEGENVSPDTDLMLDGRRQYLFDDYLTNKMTDSIRFSLMSHDFDVLTDKQFMDKQGKSNKEFVEEFNRSGRG